MNFIIRAGLLVLVCFSISNCKKRLNANESRTKFAISQESYFNPEILQTMANEGRLSFCIGFVDDQVDDELYQTIETHLINAVKTWNNFLIGMDNPSWPNSNDIEINFSKESGNCESSGQNIGAIKFLIWKNLSENEIPWHPTPAATCNSKICASAGIKEIYYNLNLKYNEDFYKVFDNVVFHEFGHILGLGDTYWQYKYVRPKDYQPQSAMRGGSQSTDDDKTGIRAVWRYIKTGKLDCGEGYLPGETFENAPQSFFCTPTKILNSDNLTITNDGDVLRILIKDKKTAEYFFANHTMPIEPGSNGEQKRVVASNFSGNQNITFSCTKSQENNFNCELILGRNGSLYVSYVYQMGERRYLAVRNDVDHNEAGKVLCDAMNFYSGVSDESGTPFDKFFYNELYDLFAGKGKWVPPRPYANNFWYCRQKYDQYFSLFIFLIE